MNFPFTHRESIGKAEDLAASTEEAGPGWLRTHKKKRNPMGCASYVVLVGRGGFEPP